VPVVRKIDRSIHYDAAFRFCLYGPLLVGLMLYMASAARGQTADLNVVATVDASCTLNGGTLDFGAYRSEEIKTARTSISYRCPEGMEISLSLGPGREADGRARAMQRDGGDGALRYQLYQDAGRSQVWGDQGDALTIPSTRDGEASVDVFGVIPAGQEVPPGTYRDTVLITLGINP
jgi:spore coat protein U-like protein